MNVMEIVIKSAGFGYVTITIDGESVCNSGGSSETEIDIDSAMEIITDELTHEQNYGS